MPARNVTLELRHAACAADDEACLRDGQLLSFGGQVAVHGVPRTPWTLLAADCDACSTLHVDECDGWEAGDRLAIAPTGHHATDYAQVINQGADPQDNFLAEEATIDAVGPAAGGAAGCAVTLQTALRLLHRGSALSGVPVRAEVANLARSVTITGPPIHWRNASRPILGGQGLTTVQMGGGVMVVEYARVERCGRVALGAYCLHWHLVGDCPECRFRGNVVEGGVNKGITVHGTHNATVDANVVYDLRGASIYVEDGNELHNTLSHNLLLCPSLSHKAQLGGLKPQGDEQTATGATGTGHRCTLLGVPEHRDSDWEEQARCCSPRPISRRSRPISR